MMQTTAPTVGQEFPEFVRDSDFAYWNRYAAVNDEFIPIHMWDEAGRAAGYPTAFGMGNLTWAYLHIALHEWFGEHATIVPDRVLLSNPGDHPTELMTLRGARLALLEETPEARHLNVKRLKDVLGTPQMTARLIRRDSVTWTATHSLFVSTNYRPRVEETDHGTWRRLALVTFPHTYRKPGVKLRGPNDLRGDPTLRERLKDGGDGRHGAVLAWLVTGARRWYENGQVMPVPPATVADDTRGWRHDST